MLRAYRADDLAALHTLDLECFEEPFQFTRADLRRYTASREAFTVVAEQGDKADRPISGFILVHLHGAGEDRFGYVVTLDVRAGQRRSGIGERLMNEGERLARERDARTLRLHVFTGNEAARRFYLRIGFAVKGLVRNFYAESLDALVLHKPI